MGIKFGYKDEEFKYESQMHVDVSNDLITLVIKEGGDWSYFCMTKEEFDEMVEFVNKSTTNPVI